MIEEDDRDASDNRAQLALTAFCWFRDRPKDVAMTYWRDIHGVLGARVPGAWQYQQLHLGPNRPDLGPANSAITFYVPADMQPEGIAAGLFLSEAEQQRFGESEGVKYLLHDEQNFLDRICIQISPTGAAATLIDGLAEVGLQGPSRLPSFAICFASRPEADAFHRHLTGIATRWARHPGIHHLRVRPLPPYDPKTWQSPGVQHDWPGGDGYLGWIDLAVEDEAALRDLYRGLDVSDETEIAAIHTYPIGARYTLVDHGRATEVGLRGYPACETIQQIGAENQHAADLLSFVYGKPI